MLNHEGKLDQPVKVYRNLRHTWGIVEVQSHAGEITRWQEMTSRETEKIEIWTNQWDVFIMKATVWRIKNTSETHGSNSRELSPMSQISDPAGDHKGKVRISQKSRFILWGPWIIAITTNLRPGVRQVRWLWQVCVVGTPALRGQYFQGILKNNHVINSSTFYGNDSLKGNYFPVNRLIF